MGSSRKTLRISQFGGWSDRKHPSRVSRFEFPDILNYDLGEDRLNPRGGYRRVHTNSLKDASCRFDGKNDYIRIGHLTSYVPASGNELYVGIGVVLRSRPAAAVTILMKGDTAAAANNLVRIVYDPTAGSGSNGAWVATVYDLGAATTRTATISDGDGFVEPVGRYRYLEVSVSVAGVVFKAWNDSNTLLDTQTATWGGTTFSSTTNDITLGVSQSSSTAIGTDFADVTLCEFRYWTGVAGGVGTRIVTSGNQWAIREVEDASITVFLGYWKLNDGSADFVVSDSTATANDGTVPNNPPPWSFDSSKIAGPSGLLFRGGDHYVYLRDQATASALTVPFTTTASGTNRRWSLSGLCTLDLKPGASAIGAQVLHWAGSDATNPAPTAVLVLTDRFRAIYRDAGGTNTQLDITSPTPTALAGLKIRWTLSRYGAGNGTLLFQIIYNVAGTPAIVNASAACPAGSSATVSRDWAWGRHVTNFSAGNTFATDGSHYGACDSLQLVWINSTTVAPIGWLGTPGGPYSEYDGWQSLNSAFSLVFHMKLNEGAGNLLQVNTEVASNFIARVVPEENDGIRWDAGLVVPYRPPEVGWMGQFNYFRSDGTYSRNLLAISGCALYRIDLTTALATPVAAGLFKGTKWTSAQYGQKLFLASNNRRRPVVYDGANLDALGIVAPLSPPTIATGGGGSLSGTYYLYVTFRNKNTGKESNPSRGVAFTVGAGSSITSIQLPVSADPQVNQRRVYMTAAGGADGSVAYLQQEYNDNVTINDTVAITALDITSVTLEYDDHQEAPQGGIVGKLQDFLFIGGNQQFPTRAYRNTTAGSFEYWNHSTSYRDLDLDTGDPICGMITSRNRLYVSLRDGAASLYQTGDSTDPVRHDILPIGHGAIGPHAIVMSSAGAIYYLSELDIYISDGETEVNLSAPASEDAPSIQTFLATQLDRARSYYVSAAENQQKGQIIFQVTETGGTRNNLAIVYNTDARSWTKYDWPFDYIAELEQVDDSPALYGATEGFICLIDLEAGDATTKGDGIDTPIQALANGGATSATVNLTVSPALRADALKGLRAWILGVTSGTVTSVQQGVIYSNTTSAITLYSSITYTNLSIVIIGGYQVYADLFVDFSNPQQLKRLFFLTAAGEYLTGTYPKIRVTAFLDSMMRTLTDAEYTATAHEFIDDWLSTDRLKIILLGGFFFYMRLRIGEMCSVADGTSLAVTTKSAVPSIAHFALSEIQIECSELDARR